MSVKPSRSVGRWGQTLARPKPSSATLEVDDTDEDSLFDFAYHEPGAMPGTLTIEADAPPPCDHLD